MKAKELWTSLLIGGGDAPAPEPVLISKNITANGEYYAVEDDADGYSSVNVNVQTPSNEDALIEDSLTGEYVNNTATSIAVRGLAYKTHVTKVVMNGVESIGNYGLTQDAALEEATFRSAVSIGDSAFSGCTALTELTIPNVKTIGRYNFQNLTNLETVNAGSIETLGNSAFEGCSKLKTIDLSSVQSIGMNGFYNCRSLTTALLSQCTSMSSSNIFSGCSSLAEVRAPLCRSLGSTCFKDCTALETVDFSGLWQLGSDTFSGCTSLAAIELPMASYLGGSRAFNGCTNLVRVEAGAPEFSSVNASLGSSTFIGCSSLTTLALRRTVSIFTLDGSSVFEGTPFNTSGSAAYIYVPAALIDTYKAATNWSLYQNRFRVLEDYTVDGTVTGALDPTKI